MLVLGHFIVAVVLVTAIISPNGFYVLGPGIACIVAVTWLWMTLWQRDQKIPFFDAGMFCALATFTYAVYPLVNYWADGYQFGSLSDNRLRVYNPDPLEMCLFHLRHVLYLFSFVASYAFFRGKGLIETGNVNTPSHSTRHVIILFFILLTAFFSVLQFSTGVNFNTSYELDSYAKHLSALEGLPLLLLQISGKMMGVLFIFKLGLLFIVVNRYRQRRWRTILLVWIAIEIVQVLYIKGARTDFILFLMGTALIYHRVIKPLTMKFLFISGAMLLIGFLFLGFYRSYFEIADMQADLSRSNAGIFAVANEFQSLLGTAYSVYRLKEAGAEFPWYLYINDFITILPPQQLLSFEKVRASEWYLRQIGLSGTGLSLMWGVISQSIVGLDWLELVFRGGILGYILARFHRWYLKHQSDFLGTLLYILLCLKVYYTFRDTTFSLLANLVWEVIPFCVILRVGQTLFSFSGAQKLWRKAGSLFQNRK